MRKPKVSFKGNPHLDCKPMMAAMLQAMRSCKQSTGCLAGPSCTDRECSLSLATPQAEIQVCSKATDCSPV